MADLEHRVSAIEARNRRVEHDKAWEISRVRAFLVIGLTYGLVGLYLAMIDIDRPWLNAVVPAIGFYLSTRVIGVAKHAWLERQRGG